MDGKWPDCLLAMSAVGPLAVLYAEQPLHRDCFAFGGMRCLPRHTGVTIGLTAPPRTVTCLLPLPPNAPHTLLPHSE